MTCATTTPLSMSPPPRRKRRAALALGACAAMSVAGAVVVTSPATAAVPVALSALTPTSVTNGWGPLEKDMSNGEQAAGDGHVITINGKRYPTGLGVHASSSVTYALNAAYASFSTDVGIDDEEGANGSVVFEVWTDGVRRAVSPRLTGVDQAQSLSVDVRGVQSLRLVVTNGGDNFSSDHADWAGASLTPAVAGSASPSPTLSPTPLPVGSPSASPTPTPTPTSAPISSPLPAPTTSGGFPSAATTGPVAAGFTSLTAYTGPSTISTPGTVISGKIITAPLVITADNVSIRGCDIHAATPDQLVYVSGRGFSISDSNIHGDGNTTATSADMAGLRLYGSNATMLRNNVWNVDGHSVMMGETTDNLIQDNYFHNHVLNPTDSPHTNVLIVGERSGPARWTVRHNTMDMWVPGHMSNVINLAVGPGNSEGPMTFDNNLLAGGGFTIHGGGDTVQTGMVFTRNHFSTKYGPGDGEYGIMRLSPAWGTNGNVWGGSGQDNVWNETDAYGHVAGQVIPAP